MDGRTVIPTFHPAAILHGGGQASSQMTSLRADFQEIRTALAERPRARRGAARPVLMHLELRAATAEDTRSIGEAAGPAARGGRCVALTGELGAGKTTFVQGLVAGWGSRAMSCRRPSPWCGSIARGACRSSTSTSTASNASRTSSTSSSTSRPRTACSWSNGGTPSRGPAERPPGGRAHERRPLTSGSSSFGPGPDVAPAVGKARTPTGALEDRAGDGASLVIVLGIDTSTQQTTVALGTEREIARDGSVRGRPPPR